MSYSETEKLELIQNSIKKFGVDSFFEKFVGNSSKDTGEFKIAIPDHPNTHSEYEINEEDSDVRYYTPSSSYTKQVLCFSGDEKLKLNYESINGTCRIGRLLESLDIISGVAAYKFVMGDKWPRDLAISLVDYNKLSSSMPFETETALVTASCSELILFEDVVLDDIFLDAKVVYVGTSSMEIEVNVLSSNEKKLLTASFSFVGISKYGKCVLPSLVLESEEEIEKFEEAQKNKQKKILRAKEIHSIVGSDDLNVVLRDLLNNFPDADLNNRELKTYTAMLPEHKNIHGKIFGGFLMRTAAELSWTCAYLCTRKIPTFRVIKEQIFLSPVEVFSVCLFSAEIIKVEGNIVHILVTTEVHNPQEHTTKTTNKFYYEFLCQ